MTNPPALTPTRLEVGFGSHADTAPTGPHVYFGPIADLGNDLVVIN